MKRRNLFLILLGASWLAGGSVNARGDEEPEADRTRAGRIVHAWDGCTMWSAILNVDYNGPPNREIPGPPAEFSQRILEELVDEEAAAQVDAIAYCLFTAFWSDVPSSKLTDLFP